MIPLRDSVKLARWPLITIALIAANVIAYLLAIRHGGTIVDGPSTRTLVAYGAVPYEFAHLGSHCELGGAGFSQAVLCTGQAGVTGTVAPQPPTWLTALTSLFVHKNLLALGLAMAFLGAFGATLEDMLGRWRFLTLYILGGLAALALTIAADGSSVTPALGASGAVAAVLGAYLVLRPRAGVLALGLGALRTRELPAWTLIGVWLTAELALGAAHVIIPAGAPAASVYGAQLGGFAVGLAGVGLLARGSTATEPPAATHV